MTDFKKGLLTGILCTVCLILCVGAGVTYHWEKKEITPVCKVKWGGLSYIPENTKTCLSDWDQKEVTPICEVTTNGLGDFVPIGKNHNGVTWKKAEVTPVVYVKYYTADYFTIDDK